MGDKVLYIDYQMWGKNDIIEAFRFLGNDVHIVDYPVRYGENSDKTKAMLEKEIMYNNYSMVFTSNYYPLVSDICNCKGTQYVSWTYDSPRIALYDKSIINRCNYAFVFDSEECMSLRNMGVDRVYYMPLGVNTDRVNSVDISSKDKDVFASEVSMVASLYNEEHNLYDRMYAKLDDYTRGYLDAVIRAQSKVFGGCFLEDALNDGIIESMYKALPYDVSETSMTDNIYVYVNYFLARKVATYQRKMFIKAISDKYQMKVYTPGDIDDIPKAMHMGTVDYETDMNKVFRLSKININVTLPSIKSGIPLRVLDIMGAGGFLITDYRKDAEGIFEDGVDLVYYNSLEDALGKIQYYLEHEDERSEIADNGRRKIENVLTYRKRIIEMLDIVRSNND